MYVIYLVAVFCVSHLAVITVFSAPMSSSTFNGYVASFSDINCNAGKDLSSYPSVSSDSCQTQCYQNQACTGFVYQSSSSYCWLKSSMASCTTYSGLVSNVRLLQSSNMKYRYAPNFDWGTGAYIATLPAGSTVMQ